ncbi:hypothetical protein DL768_009057 [Monosporascus sp. mg162]|nr:hypothetical protein DL768_009057 [Monosporascus sp. mg162]
MARLSTWQVKLYHIYSGFNLVGYLNRYSTGYKERYNIPEAPTITRGTLRYAGFPEFVKVLADIGFLKEEEQRYCKEPIPYKEATQKILATPSDEKDLIGGISAKIIFKNNE